MFVVNSFLFNALLNLMNLKITYNDNVNVKIINIKLT